MNIKNFIKKHKTKICITTIIGGSIVTSIILTKKFSGFNGHKLEGLTILEDLTNSNNDRRSRGLSKEEVIEYLDFVGVNDKFAIFKESELFEIIEL